MTRRLVSGHRLLAAYQSEARRSVRAREVAQAAYVEMRLTSAHLIEHPPATRPVVRGPEPVDRAALLAVYTRDALAGVRVLRRAERKAAREIARERVERVVAEEVLSRGEDHRRRQIPADAAWTALVANDAAAVLAALEVGLAAADVPAAPVDVRADVARIVMLAADPGVVPDRKPAVTPSGQPTLRKRTKGERNDLYVSIVASHVLAAAKRALAVAPALEQARVLVLRRQPSAGLNQERLEALYYGTFTRETLARADWTNIDLRRVLDDVPAALIVRRGRTRELAPLNLSREPELATIVSDVERALSNRR